MWFNWRKHCKHIALAALAFLLLSVVSVVAQQFGDYFVRRIYFGSSSGPIDTSGTGVPSASSPAGSTFRRTDGSACTTFYTREGGAWQPQCSSSASGGVTTSNTKTLTNTSYDAEGAGNVLTLVEKRDFPTALCVASSGYEEGGWSYDAVNPDAYTNSCHNGSNTKFASVEFLDGSAGYYQNKIWLPSDWTGAIDVRLAWNTAATSGNVKWGVQTVCVASGGTLDPVWNSASTVTQAAQGTTLRLGLASIAGVTTTSCAAGNLMFFRVLRDPTDVADTLGASAFLIEVEMTYRRAI